MVLFFRAAGSCLVDRPRCSCIGNAAPLRAHECLRHEGGRFIGRKNAPTDTTLRTPSTVLKNTNHFEQQQQRSLHNKPKKEWQKRGAKNTLPFGST